MRISDWSSDVCSSDLWEQIRGGLRRDCGARTFDGWLRPIALGGFDPACGTVRLELPSQFMADWVQTHFAERLALAWRGMLPAVRHVSVGVGANAQRSAVLADSTTEERRVGEEGGRRV